MFFLTLVRYVTKVLAKIATLLQMLLNLVFGNRLMYSVEIVSEQHRTFVLFYMLFMTIFSEHAKDDFHRIQKTISTQKI